MAAHSHCSYTAVASKEAGLRNGIGFFVLEIKNQNQNRKIKIKFVPFNWNGSQPHTGSPAGHRGEPGVDWVACEPMGAGALGCQGVTGPSVRARGD